MIGQVIGHYKIVSQLGEGGMGAVYCALDLMLEREVAIKALKAELARQPQVVERFRAEAITLAKLNHPYIATLYSFFRQADDYYMVMEYVRGEPLDAVLRREGALPVGRAVRLFCEALEGVGRAHRLGIIHRDLKLSNLMLTDEDSIKVMDFGIARVLGTARMTRQGHLIGTIEYMSPEQIRGGEADARSDIYSLGILLYEMLTGRVPFASDSDYDLMRMQVEVAPPSPRAFVLNIPESIERAIMRALAKSPAERFQSVAEFRTALLAAPAPAPPVFAPPYEPRPTRYVAPLPEAFDDAADNTLDRAPESFAAPEIEVLAENVAAENAPAQKVPAENAATENRAAANASTENDATGGSATVGGAKAKASEVETATGIEVLATPVAAAPPVEEIAQAAETTDGSHAHTTSVDETPAVEATADELPVEEAVAEKTTNEDATKEDTTHEAAAHEATTHEDATEEVTAEREASVEEASVEEVPVEVAPAAEDAVAPLTPTVVTAAATPTDEAAAVESGASDAFTAADVSPAEDFPADAPPASDSASVEEIEPELRAPTPASVFAAPPTPEDRSAGEAASSMVGASTGTSASAAIIAHDAGAESVRRAMPFESLPATTPSAAQSHTTNPAATARVSAELIKETRLAESPRPALDAHAPTPRADARVTPAARDVAADKKATDEKSAAGSDDLFASLAQPARLGGLGWKTYAGGGVAAGLLVAALLFVSFGAGESGTTATPKTGGATTGAQGTQQTQPPPTREQPPRQSLAEEPAAQKGAQPQSSPPGALTPLKPEIVTGGDQAQRQTSTKGSRKPGEKQRPGSSKPARRLTEAEQRMIDAALSRNKKKTP